MTTKGKHVRPAPVYEAHFADGAVERMSFSWPKGKPLDPARGKRGCILAYNGDIWRRSNPPGEPVYFAGDYLSPRVMKHWGQETDCNGFELDYRPIPERLNLGYMDWRTFREEVEFRLSYDAPFVRGFVEHPLIGRIEDTGEPIKTAAKKMPRGELAAQVRCLVKWIIDQPGAPASVVATALEVYEAA